MAKALQKLAGITADIGHCNCNVAGNCLNMSMCAYTTGADEFTVIAWNPEGQNVSAWLSVPVSGAAYTVTDLTTKQTIPSQAMAGSREARGKRTKTRHAAVTLARRSAWCLLCVWSCYCGNDWDH